MQSAVRLACGLGALALATVACGAHAAALARDARVRLWYGLPRLRRMRDLAGAKD